MVTVRTWMWTGNFRDGVVMLLMLASDGGLYGLYGDGRPVTGNLEMLDISRYIRSALAGASNWQELS